jgi:hypothetical protein
MALEYPEAMPRYLWPVISALLARFHECGCWRAIYRESAPEVRRWPLSTWESRFVRAGYPSPTTVLHALRLSIAYRLLDEGWERQRIAYDMGCSSPQSFARWFRHQTGRTPTTRGTLDAAATIRAAMSPQLALPLARPTSGVAA